MAVYTKFDVAGSVGQSLWAMDLIELIKTARIDWSGVPSKLVITTQYGVELHLAGNGFGVEPAKNPDGSTYMKPLGTITGVQVTSLGGATVYEKVEGINVPFDYPFDPSLAGIVKLALSGNDTFVGDTARNRFLASSGDDTFDGKGGVDTMVYSGAFGQYKVTVGQGAVTVADTAANRDGTDSLTAIERLQFTDTTLAFDEGAGQVYRLYQAAFSRTPDKGGLSYWVDKMDDGLSLRDIVYGFINSGEFQKAYGNSLTNAQLVVQLYTNILGRAPEKAGSDYWIGELDRGTSRLDVFAAISESGENKDKLKAVIGQGIELETAAFA